MRRMFSTTAISAALLLVMPLRIAGGAPRGDAGATHSARQVRLGLRDGSSTIVRLDGVGCDESICSRVAVNSRTVGNVIVNRTRFEDIKAVEDIGGDTAVFVLKEGTRRRVSIISDNRVLYVTGQDGNARKISLRHIRAIDFTIHGVQ